MLPNLFLPILALHFWWLEPVHHMRQALGWEWTGWRSVLSGTIAFIAIYLLLKVVGALLGDGIPYNLPGTADDGITIRKPADVLKLLSLLVGLAAFVAITVAAAETMFRGWIQTQVGQRFGVWFGLFVGAVLFGLRHLSANLFYAQIWQATPQIWLSRQVQLYVSAPGLGLARHFGKSPCASAITHALILVVAFFGLGQRIL
jgi:membrane protease YdiL (CAAX protease family)